MHAEFSSFAYLQLLALPNLNVKYVGLLFNTHIWLPPFLTIKPYVLHYKGE